MANDKSQTIVPCLNTVTPHLVVSDAIAAIEFYKKAFGAIEQMRLPAPSGKLIHASLKLGNSHVMLCEEARDWGKCSPMSLNGSPVTIHLQLEGDVDVAFQKAIAAGATEVMAPADMFWGDRYGVLTDPFGHSWSIATKVRNVTPEELQAGAAACCTG